MASTLSKTVIYIHAQSVTVSKYKVGGWGDGKAGKALDTREGLGQNPQSPHKRPDMVIPTCNPRDLAASLAPGSVRDPVSEE